MRLAWHSAIDTASPATISASTVDIISLPLIVFEAGSGTRTLIDGWFQQAGLQVTPVMPLGSIEAIKRMVVGYSIIPRMAVARRYDSEGLHVQSLSPLLYRQLGVVLRQDKIRSKGITEVIRLLQQHEWNTPL